MLDGLLGRGFSSKCKSLIKATRTRIDVVRRRTEATQRFLKGNLAQLLSNGIDINAFGRTEEFLAGLNLLACYDFLEQSCEYILKKLSLMQKQRECPEECREAVGSLMFAAARFSDLPELRDLRDALQERYESSLEHFVNQEFFERLAMKPPTMDKKIQLLEDIASELSIKWDSRGFQQRMMTNPSVPAQNQAKKPELIHDRGATFNLLKDNEAAINSNKQDQLVKEKRELKTDWLKAKNGGENSMTRKNEVGHRSLGGVESTGKGGKPHMGGEHKTAERDNYDMTPRGRRVKDELSSDELQAKNGSQNYLLKEELDHQSFRRGDSIGNNQKLHIGTEGNTPPTTRINGKEDSVHRRNGQGSSSRGKRSDFFDEHDTPQEETYGVTPRFKRNITDDENQITRINGKEEIVHRRERYGSSSKGKRLEDTDSIYEVQNNKVYGFPKSYGNDLVADNKQEEVSISRDGKNGSSEGYSDYKESSASKSLQITTREDTELLKPNSGYALPPPYVKSKDKLVPPPYLKTIEAQKTSSNRIGASVDPTPHKRDDMDGRSERVRREEDKAKDEAMGTYGHEKDAPSRDHIPLPRPRSIRKKHSKSSSNCDALGDYEDLEVSERSSTSRRRDHHSKKGLQILFEGEHKQRDDEDRKLDKLLLHYSKKPSTYDEKNARRKMKSQAREASNNGFNEGQGSGFPTRSVSLPREQVPLQEQVKVYARANSFQPDKPAGHVHPKLPDYDDLAARFAALKGR